MSAGVAVREGGAAACVLRMCFGSKTGFQFAKGLSKETLYAPQEGALVVELSSEADLSGDTALHPVVFGPYHRWRPGGVFGRPADGSGRAHRSLDGHPGEDLPQPCPRRCLWR